MLVPASLLVANSLQQPSSWMVISCEGRVRELVVHVQLSKCPVSSITARASVHVTGCTPCGYSGRWMVSVRCQENHHHTTTVLRPFFWDHPGEPVPEENFWALWCKGTLTEADTLTIWLGATPSGLTSAHLHHPRHMLYRPIDW